MSKKRNSAKNKWVPESTSPSVPFPDSPLQDFDFSVLDSKDFKEDSVREEIILPILQTLGYAASGQNKIIRSKPLEHPFLTVGSSKRPITLIPDYLLTVDNNFAFALDAKAPNEEIKTGHNVEQVYSYAVHPEIRVELFALCNGREFILFDVGRKEALLYFHVSEIAHHWEEVCKYLAPIKVATQLPKRLRNPIAYAKDAFDYLGIIPPTEITNFQKQTAKRHFGVHGYFTKQVWSVVQHYIKTFTKPGDIILDPYGGSGVTLVEALMLGRKGIHIDINPLSKFIVENLIRPLDFAKLGDSFRRIVEEYQKDAPQTEEEIKKALKKYPYPHGIELMRNADVRTIEQLFSPKQLAQLAYLKHLIQQEKGAIRDCLMLMLSGLVNKVNLTYHSSEGRTEGRGDSSAFRYYRFRIAHQPAEIDMMTYFKSRFKKVVAAKQEIAGLINANTVKDAKVLTPGKKRANVAGISRSQGST